MKIFFTYILLFTLFTNSASSQQEHNKVNGFYNLSDFELSSGIYLLENKTFYYFATFGSADLKIFGTYTISDTNILNLKADKEFTSEFYIYGFNNSPQNKKATIHYYKPHVYKAEKLIIVTGKKRHKLPKFNEENKIVSTTLKLPKKRIIKVGYKNPAIETYNTIKIKNTPKIKIPPAVDEIVIYHNYYFEMVFEVLQMRRYHINNNILTIDSHVDIKTAEKNEITKKTEIKIIDFIEQQKKNNSQFVKNEKAFYKLEYNTN